ncbi:hypothetical protein LINPERHAP1_LOCUS15156 [Linum perenne]
MHEDGVVNPRCPRVQFSEEEIAQFYKPWSKALVVRVLDKSFPYQTLKRRLEFLWAKKGRIQVADLSNDFFLVRFSDADDYHRAAFEGPWKIVVSRIGDHIGRTVRLDLTTAEGARACYTRVCVEEVDLSKPLLDRYMIGNRVFYVEYECLENLCYFCGMYGHKHDSCPDLAEPLDPTPVADPPKANESVVAEEGDAGSWMTVSRCRKKKPGKQAQDNNQGFGSRFTILQRVQEEVVAAADQGSGKAQAKASTEAITKLLFPMPAADDKGLHPRSRWVT